MRPDVIGLIPARNSHLCRVFVKPMGSRFRRHVVFGTRAALSWSVSVWLTVLFGPLVSGAFSDETENFEKTIRPLLLEKCVECHGPKKQEGGIRLDRRNEVLSGKVDDVRLLTPGQPEASRIFQVIQHSENDVAMPPAGKLEESVRESLRQWILNGAIWPENADLEGEAKRRSEQWREHWAFQPVSRLDPSRVPPDVHPVDFLIRGQLEKHGLTLSPPASPQVLVRRLSDALVGLPPEPADLQGLSEAVKSSRWEAWRSDYVGRLLASPHFGERWGRHWLDVARYADTKGYVFQEDREYKDAWRYREWVIRALNADMPYDEFLKRQLAADRLPGADDPNQLAAMGFLTLGRRFLNNPHDIIDDRIDLVSRGMLGLTAACARCHDHKYDPIPMADYYSLYGVFASSDEPKDSPSPLRLVDRSQPVEPVIFLRGSPGNRGDQVPRRFFTALSRPDAPPFRDGSGRLELANAIADKSNPLTARVAVNRVWLHLFGRGLVDSPSDFGVRTDRPIQHQLMDYLAAFYMENGWSLKSLIRHIVSSAAWQQDASWRPDAAIVDPENRLFARMNRRRLDFEAWRDAVLFVSGRLDHTIGGESTDIAADSESRRRSVYARIDRQNLPGVFRTFDFPNPDNHAPLRFETTVPQQALFQLNSAFLMNRAADLAEASRSISVEGGLAPRIDHLFRTILQRPASSAETTASAGFIRQTESAQGGMPLAGWSYGYGTLRDDARRLSEFQPLPWSGGGKWQGGPELPDGVLGWTSLHQKGGHPGTGPGHCAVRRWTADTDCRVILNGVVGHSAEAGDGIRFLTIVNQTVLSDVNVQNQTLPLAAGTAELKAGMSVDFVACCRSNPSHDSFSSKLIVTQVVDGNVLRIWNSEQDFTDRTGAARLDAWAQLAQTLLLTNEFMFTD